MLFNSSEFLLFFAAFMPTYWLLYRNCMLRNALVVAGSYVFYASWDWRFLSLLIISTLADFVCGSRIAASHDQRVRRLWLGVSVAINLGILGTFKYFDFFVSSFADLLAGIGLRPNLPLIAIVLPVGISFYTFQTMSYTIDIYRDHCRPARDLLSFAAFVAFFPQLVAGPIERARNLLPQIEGDVRLSLAQIRDGAWLVLWGLCKKVLIADRVAVYVDTVFAAPDAYSPATCVTATLLFAVQIYCDFSGYSDIARGLAKMLGIELMVNFDAPYFARSIREFWHCWHISLSTWFRDYVFVPLGGSRRSSLITKRNLLITFVVSGIWHGAAYNFLI
jgi:alginate O-acetyltransferase complex protein AlgI